MAIDRDDRDERAARLQAMIEEFQEARRRYLVTPRCRVVKPTTRPATVCREPVPVIE